MTLPFSLGTIPLPDWMPGWLPVMVLIPVILWLLLLLAMPFAVLGTRSRLEAIEAQLDDLHAELRHLAVLMGPMGMPLPERPRGERARGDVRGDIRGEIRPDEEGRPGSPRSEPRINWPPRRRRLIG